MGTVTVFKKGRVFARRETGQKASGRENGDPIIRKMNLMMEKVKGEAMKYFVRRQP